jgi:hypothetical protein
VVGQLNSIRLSIMHTDVGCCLILWLHTFIIAFGGTQVSVTELTAVSESKVTITVNSKC